jgi:hypothetical protein
MRRKRLTAVGTVLGAVVLSAALAFLGLVAMARDQVPAGSDHWDVSSSYSHMEPVEGSDGLAATFVCDIEIRSKEVPSFAQRTENGVTLGWRLPAAGGIHDWTLFTELDSWPRARRVALLQYLVSRGNPFVSAVSVADPQVTTDTAIAPGSLVDVASWSRDQPVSEILGMQSSSGQYVRVSP